MRQGRRIRVIALAALAAALVAVAAVLVLGGEGYRVTTRLVNASQLVKGNLVTIAGEQVGQVEDIRLADDGLAEIEVSIDEDHAPLRAGTRAVVRQGSLSGVANRYIDLHLGGASGRDIGDGGTIPAVDTQSNVDLDQLFNTFDPETRAAVGGTIRLFRDFNAGNEEEAGRALRYLAPSLSATSRLFREVHRSRRDFERFVVETAQLTTDLATRGDDLAGTVRGLATTMDALATERDDLGRSIELLPDVLRRANTTFVNLRSALGDLDPLVAAARPAARAATPLFAELRPFAADAVPTVRDLSQTIRRPGEANDLVELLRLQPAVDLIATRDARRNGEVRPGTFPVTERALRGLNTQLRTVRPFTPELVGWFDDFAHSGAYDALGGFSRAGLGLPAFTATPAAPGGLLPVPLDLRDDVAFGSLRTGRNNRCPGGAERPAPDASNPFVPDPLVNCDRNQQPQGETAGPVNSPVTTTPAPAAPATPAAPGTRP